MACCPENFKFQYTMAEPLVVWRMSFEEAMVPHRTPLHSRQHLALPLALLVLLCSPQLEQKGTTYRLHQSM